jgi:hypothetical protein
MEKTVRRLNETYLTLSKDIGFTVYSSKKKDIDAKEITLRII